MRRNNRTVRQLRHSALVALTLTLPLAACSSSTIRSMPDTPHDPTATAPTASNNDAAPKPTGTPLTPAEALTKATESSNRLGFDLYQRALQAQKGNVAMSSVSIANALAMTFSGAKGETATEMAAVLRAPAHADSLHAGFEEMAKTLSDADQPYTLSNANRLYVANEVDLEPSFAERTKQHYGASAEKADFRHAPDAARKTINSWVEGQTKERIKDLLPGGSITADTGLVLTNAIYFKGQWAFPFGEKLTKAGAFQAAAGEMSVSYMQRVANYTYAEVDAAKLVRLPYQGGTLAMTLVLPNEGSELKALEDALSHRRFVSWQAAMASKRLDVRLPKFKIESDAAVNLSNPLQALGMKRAFTDSAEFGGISSTPLSITDVFHKAFVEVDEKGTEAAAATAVVMTVRGMLVQEDPELLRFDRPFLFFIHHTKTNAILFQGRVVKPTPAS